MTPQQTEICFEFACLKTHITSIARLATLNTDDITAGCVSGSSFHVSLATKYTWPSRSSNKVKDFQ